MRQVYEVVLLTPRSVTTWRTFGDFLRSPSYRIQM